MQKASICPHLCLRCHHARAPTNLPGQLPHLIIEEKTLPWLLPPFHPRPARSTGRPYSLAGATRTRKAADSQPLLHQGCTVHTELSSRATPDPLELIFIYNVSSDLRAQDRKQRDLLLGTPSHKHASKDEILQFLTTGRDEQMGTKSRGLFCMWANPFKHLHSPAIK